MTESIIVFGRLFKFEFRLNTERYTSDLGNRLNGSLQSQLVRYDSDEFTIRRLSLAVVNRIAEKTVDRFQFSSVPRYLDGMPDGALDPG